MRSFKRSEDLFFAIYIGSILALISVIFLFHGTILIGLTNFFSSLTLAQVPGTGIYLPAPIAPTAHVDLYAAAFQFCLGLGLIEVIILLLRFLFESPLKRKAETIENIVFWFGASYLIIAYLNDSATINTWFVFWAGIIMIFGLSLIARAFVLLVKRQPAPAQPAAPPAQPACTTPT
jgi:tellurite resistance protein TehA-like permease